MPLGDVSSTYADIRRDVVLADDRCEGLARDGRDHARRRAGADASRMWGKRQGVVPLSFANARRVHIWSGRLAVLCTLPVFFHCVTMLGFKTPDARVAIHSIAGSFVYGVLAAKLLVIRHRSRNYAPWVLPVLGGSLAAVLTTLWLTSSLWYFTTVRFGF
ncbi:MAG: hypothetical protein H0W16_00800 [Actinobacteria bacterium]|nr:hypothetical protein [Actinomycetota bacterium]